METYITGTNPAAIEPALKVWNTASGNKLVLSYACYNDSEYDLNCLWYTSADFTKVFRAVSDTEKELDFAASWGVAPYEVELDSEEEQAFEAALAEYRSRNLDWCPRCETKNLWRMSFTDAECMECDYVE